MSKQERTKVFETNYANGMKILADYKLCCEQLENLISRNNVLMGENVKMQQQLTDASAKLTNEEQINQELVLENTMLQKELSRFATFKQNAESTESRNRKFTDAEEKYIVKLYFHYKGSIAKVLEHVIRVKKAHDPKFTCERQTIYNVLNRKGVKVSELTQLKHKGKGV